MTSTKRLLGAVSALALVASASTPALAAGTGAGEIIQNTVTVDYTVGGVDQTQISDSDEFTVDRKVNVTVAAVGASPAVSANQQNVVRQFTVTNTSNDTVGFALTTEQDASPDFALSNVIIFDDLDGDGQYDVGEEITFIDSLAADATRNVWVVFDIASDAANTESADIHLVANAHEAGSGSIGAEITATAGANTAGIDTVLADITGTAPSDEDNEGDHSASHTLTVNAANLSVVKSSSVIWDPVNLFTNPKNIPGARVEYCIVVTNAAGSATATDVDVSDTLPTETTFYPDAYPSGGTDFDVMVDGSATCTGGTGVDGYTTASTAVDELLSDIAGGVSRSLYFQVTID